MNDGDNNRKAMAFEQLPRESAKAFEAFALYLGMGPARSMAAVGKQLEKSEGLIERWCSRYDWPARVKAHAAHMAAVERQATEAAVRSKAAEWLARQVELREREWTMHEKALKLADEAITRWMADPNRRGSLEGIARLLEVASKMGRMASGLVTDHTEVTGEIDVNLRIEIEEAIEKVYGDVIDVEAEIRTPKTESRNNQSLVTSAPTKKEGV